MTNLQRQILEKKEKEGDAETVRGQQELPSLPEWTASSGPVASHDWAIASWHVVVFSEMVEDSDKGGRWVVQWSVAVASDWSISIRRTETGEMGEIGEEGEFNVVDGSPTNSSGGAIYYWHQKEWQL